MADSPLQPEPTPSASPGQPVSSIVRSCPRCGSQVEPGYAPVSHWINWVEVPGTLDAAIWKKDQLISFADANMVPHVPGVRCRKCGLAVLDFAALL
jgi:Domain of unknown function (DUF6487)